PNETGFPDRCPYCGTLYADMEQPGWVRAKPQVLETESPSYGWRGWLLSGLFWIALLVFAQPYFRAANSSDGWPVVGGRILGTRVDYDDSDQFDLKDNTLFGKHWKIY